MKTLGLITDRRYP